MIAWGVRQVWKTRLYDSQSFMSEPKPSSASTVELPVRGKRSRVRGKPKGRAVDPKAREEVRALLGNEPRRRDLLIEHLH